MEPIVVVMRSKRRERAQAVQKLQHLAPAIILLTEGMTILTHEAHGIELLIGLLEIVSGGLFVFAALGQVRGLRRSKASAHAHPHEHEHGVDWIDVYAAGVVAVETVEHYHRTGHITRPNVLMVLLLLTLAFFHGKITGLVERRRSLRVSDEGIAIGVRGLLRRKQAPWNCVRRIDIGDRFATIETSSGWSRRIDLSDLLNPEAVRGALETARGRLQEG